MPTSAPIRVKFISRIQLPDNSYGRDYLRRFPGRIPRWGACEFIFDEQARDYDWLVVYDDMPRKHSRETLACAPVNTLLVTSEPSCITAYGRAFTRQFGHVLTSQESWALKHPGVIRQQAGLLWCYGGKSERGSFDSLASAPLPPKTKLISTVCSAKSMRHTLHDRRLAFTRRLARDLPEMDVFGFGMNPIEDKSDALLPYKYHLAIENHIGPHHWTEKLSDSYLGYSLPIYAGCPNVASYFPEESVLPINIYDYQDSLAKIRAAIASNLYERSLPALLRGRELALRTYSTFPAIASVIEGRHSPGAVAAAGHVVKGRRDLRSSAQNALGDMFNKTFRKVFWTIHYSRPRLARS